MMQHVATLISDKIITDQETNNISLINITEKFNINIAVPKKEANLIKEKKLKIDTPLVLTSIWYREKFENEENFEFKIKLLDPKKVAISEFTKTINFPENISRIRVKVQLNKLEVTTSGIYNFVIYKKNKKWEKVQLLPIDINLNIEKVD